MNKTVRYTLYALIITICIVAIIIGVYDQFFREDTKKGKANEVNTIHNENLVTEQDIKQSFLDLFTNELYSNYDESNVKKIDGEKDIVYTAYSKKETVDGKYNIDINIPMINISGNIPNGYNTITQNIFVDKINSIMSEANVNTIYNLDYIAYTNNSILSVAIKATIKEGNSAQRVIIQTYNYDLEKNQNVEVKDILKNRDIEESIVENRIQSVIKKASDDAEKMAESGYKVYKRELDDNIYKIENIQNFIQGPNGELYIIFAYGNNNETSEMDIIEI